MEPEIPSLISVVFILLVFSLLFLIVFGYRKALGKSGMDAALRKRSVRSLLIPLLIWLLFLSKISGMNFFHNWSAMPPRLMIAGLPPLIFAIVLVTSPKFMAILQYIPQHWLVLIQSFRIVMEVILLRLFLSNVIPVQMTFEGRNFDVLAGITALIVGYFVYRKKISTRFIILWNVFGLALLANIFLGAILSAPVPFRVFVNEPSNTMIAYFPFVWLPGFVVPVAYTMHMLSIKKCLAEKTY